MVTEGLKAEIKFSFDAYSWNQILRGGSPHTWYARMRDDDNNLVYEEKSLGSNTLSYTSDYATWLKTYCCRTNLYLNLQDTSLFRFF